MALALRPGFDVVQVKPKVSFSDLCRDVSECLLEEQKHNSQEKRNMV